MARYYSTFDNSTVAALEANAVGYWFLRVPFVGDGAALRTTALNARTALDNNVRPQINLANNNGTLGIVVPRDGMTRGASDIAIPNLYTNPAAVDPGSDTRTRPTADILVAGSTAVSPADSLSIPNALYDDAVNATTALVQGSGVYSRLGNDANKTMRSLWHDRNLTYFAWDTFTPERPASIQNLYGDAMIAGGMPTSARVTWADPHPFDAANAICEWHIWISNDIEIDPDHSGGGVRNATASSTTASPSDKQGVLSLPSGLEGGWRYKFEATVQFRYSDGTLGPLAEKITYKDIY